MNQVADRVIQSLKGEDQIVLVLSAMAGETDRLVNLGEQACEQGFTREHDLILATGEQASAALMALVLSNKGQPSQSLTGWQAGICTDSTYSQAKIKAIDPEPIRHCLSQGIVPVVAGFQGVSEAGEITTLGRGGSDTTAVALAVALKADECQIYTDVDGVLTTDPRIVSEAQLLDQITTEEMAELAGLGGKVLHSRSVALAGKHKTPLRVLSSLRQSSGTLITQEQGDLEAPEISGIGAIKDEAKLTVRHLQDKPGSAYRILGPVSEQGIDVDMVVQNVSEQGMTDFTFTVKKADYHKTKALLLERFSDHHGIAGDPDVAKVSIVGMGMRSHAGVASKMFRALAEANINIQMISTSEIKISVIIEEAQTERAVTCLHTAFGLARESSEE